jgi:hypothetical protein
VRFSNPLFDRRRNRGGGLGGRASPPADALLVVSVTDGGGQPIVTTARPHPFAASDMVYVTTGGYVNVWRVDTVLTPTSFVITDALTGGNSAFRDVATGGQVVAVDVETVNPGVGGDTLDGSRWVASVFDATGGGGVGGDTIGGGGGAFARTTLTAPVALPIHVIEGAISPRSVTAQTDDVMIVEAPGAEDGIDGGQAGQAIACSGDITRSGGAGGTNTGGGGGCGTIDGDGAPGDTGNGGESEALGGADGSQFTAGGNYEPDDGSGNSYGVEGAAGCGGGAGGAIGTAVPGSGGGPKLTVQAYAVRKIPPPDVHAASFEDSGGNLLMVLPVACPAINGQYILLSCNGLYTGVAYAVFADGGSSAEFTLWYDETQADAIPFDAPVSGRWDLLTKQVNDYLVDTEIDPSAFVGRVETYLTGKGGEGSANQGGGGGAFARGSTLTSWANPFFVVTEGKDYIAVGPSVDGDSPYARAANGANGVDGGAGGAAEDSIGGVIFSGGNGGGNVGGGGGAATILGNGGDGEAGDGGTAIANGGLDGDGFDSGGSYLGDAASDGQGIGGGGSAGGASTPGGGGQPLARIVSYVRA